MTSRGVAALAIITTLTGFGCASSEVDRSPASRAYSTSWYESMRELSTTLSSLLPMLATNRPLETENDRAQIIRYARKLSTMAHQVNSKTNGFGADPSLRAVAREFQKDMDQAIQRLEGPDWNGGQRQLARVTQYCIGCHTMREGAMKPAWAVKLSPDFISLNNREKAEYFAATRQFDKAIIHFEYALTDQSWAEKYPAEWNSAFQKLFAIVVRVRKNPALSQELLSRFFDATSYPKDLEPSARLWRQQIKQWRKEEAARKGRPSAKQQLARARRLIEEGDSVQGGAGNQKGFLLYLRASEVLQDLLALQPNGAIGAEMAYRAGQAAERLAQLNFWTLPEDYYRLCAYQGKGTQWAQRCNARLTELGGTSIASKTGKENS